MKPTRKTAPAAPSRAPRSRQAEPQEEAPPARRERARSAPAASNTPSRRSAPPQDDGGVYTGDDVLSKFEREEERAHERDELRKSGVLYLNRFYVPQGEDREIIILDQSLGKGMGFYEHNLKGPDGKYGVYEMCIKEKGTCPLCAQFGESYFVLYLSILDLTGFTTKKGRKVEQSKSMLCIKRTQFSKFKEIEAAAIEAHGTLRGTYLAMHRPTGAVTSSPRIGEPSLLKGGKLFDHYTEKELKAEFGHAAVKGENDGKIIRPADFDITVFPYRDIFKFPEVVEFQRKHGGGPTAGSAAEGDDEWGPEEQATGRAPRERAGRSASTDDDGDDPLAHRPAASRRR